MANKEKESVNVTEADKIWNEIKDIEIPIFALPNQKVHQYVNRVKVPGDQLLIVLNSTSVLPVLESTLTNFEFEVAEGYTIVRRKAPKVDVSKLVEK